jgi:antitoxin FitA
MPTITVKNIPPALYEHVKKAAKLNHRSINSEIIVCLENAYYPNAIDVKSVLERARKIRELTAKYWVTDEEINEMKAEGRL